jgi:hypothetical protein
VGQSSPVGVSHGDIRTLVSIFSQQYQRRGNKHSKERTVTLEPAFKDMLQTSDLIRIVETFTRKFDYKDTCSSRIALTL